VWHNGRRVLIDPGWRCIRAEMAACASERDALKEELAEVKRDRDALRQAITDMLAARRELREATADVANTERRHSIERAALVVRDPAQPLN